MIISWVLWWIVSAFELIVFASFSAFLWMREVDGSGAIQTTGVKWVNILVLLAAFAIPFMIQIAWLITNILVGRESQEADKLSNKKQRNA